MNNIVENKIGLIDETVEYYTENDRALEGSDHSNICMYSTSDGKHCAAGRLFTKDALQVIEDKDLEGKNPFVIYSHCRDTDVQPLKDQYLFLLEAHDDPRDSMYFVNRLQNLHDKAHFWSDDGLSDIGEDYVANLKEQVRKKRL